VLPRLSLCASAALRGLPVLFLFGIVLLLAAPGVSAGDAPAFYATATITYYTPRPTFTATATATRTPTATSTILGVRTAPQDGTRGVAADSSIRLIFDRPVDRVSVLVTLAVPVDGAWNWDPQNANVLVFKPYDELPASTTLTVTLASGARGLDGAALAGAYSWSFTTGASQRYMGWGQGPNVQVLDVAGLRRIDYYSQGIPRVRARLYAVTPQRWVQLYAESYQGLDYWGERSKEIDTSGLQQVMDLMYFTNTDQYGYRSSLQLPAGTAPGLYVLKLSAVNAESIELFVALSHNTLILKYVDGEIVAWVSAIQDGRPAAGASVSVYTDDQRLLTSGSTDAQGVARFTGLPTNKPMLVIADAGGDVTLTGMAYDWKLDRWSWWWRPAEPSAPGWTATVYTDRPIYRPGQTVYAKALLRADDDAQYTTPAGQAVTLRLRDSRDYVIAERALTTSAFGTVAAEFVIAQGAALGDYNVELVIAGTSYRQVLKVEEYRKPVVEVSVVTDRPQYALRDTMTVTITARYLFGQPAAGLPVTLQAFGLDSYAYDWETDTFLRQWVKLAAPQTSGTTDANGVWVVQVAAPYRDRTCSYYWSCEFYSWWEESEAQSISLEALVSDNSGPVAGHAALLVYRAAYGLTVRPERHDMKPGVAMPVAVLARGIGGKPMAGAEITLGVYGWNRLTGDMDQLVAETQVTTDANGDGRTEFTISQQGFYELRGHAKDAAGRDVTAETWLWVYDWQSTSGFWNGRAGELKVTADRASYRPGDVAQLLVESPVTGTALLTLERGKTREVLPVEITGPVAVVAVPIKAEYAPNIFATISIYRPDVPDDYDWYSYHDATLLSAQAELIVPADDRRLTLSATSDRATAAPGESIDLSVQVTGADGAPVQAEISVAVVDESIYLLSADLSADLFETFYGRRSDIVQTYESLHPARVLGAEHGGGGGDGGPSDAGGMRRDFPDTALWLPAVVTGADGRAVVRVTLPDTLTRWRIVVKAVTAENQVRVGETSTSVTVTQAVIVRPLAPRVLVEHDTVELSAVVSNYSARAAAFTVWTELDGLRNDSPITQTFKLEPGASVVAGWTVTANARGTATIRVYARAVSASPQGDVGRDAVELTVPVVALGVPEVWAQSGQIADEASAPVVRPSDVLVDASTVEIRLSPSIAGGMLEGLGYLTGYPYGCVEQTMSRALPNAVVSRAFRLAGRGSDGLPPDLPKMVDASIQRLYGFQHGDGGWGWWFDDDSDAYQTAYVLFGLATTREAGYAVDEAALTRGAEYLAPQLDKLDVDTRAYALYALAVTGQGDLAATRAAAGLGDKVSVFGRAGLALALEQLGDHAGAVALLDELSKLAIDNGTTAYWKTGLADGHYHQKTMASDVRTTALMLDALVRIEPDSPLTVRVVQWLMARRTAEGWGTTQETSYTIYALSDYLMASNELAAGSNYVVEINGVKYAEGVLAAGETDRVVLIPATALNEGANDIHIRRTGEGRLYYVVRTRWVREQSEVAAMGPITVTREYLKDGKPVIWPAPVGTLITVRLTVVLPSDGWYVLVEDRLPAGFEAINDRLAISSYEGGREERASTSWRDLGYNYKDVRDDRVAFFITHLQKGKSTFTYTMRALQNGRFTALPAEASLMYDLATWGRSASAVVVVGAAAPSPQPTPVARPREELRIDAR
jgi:uncharacterized protein YfaS (alpha-2-macroglobulin family)